VIQWVEQYFFQAPDLLFRLNIDAFILILIFQRLGFSYDLPFLATLPGVILTASVLSHAIVRLLESYFTLPRAIIRLQQLLLGPSDGPLLPVTEPPRTPPSPPGSAVQLEWFNARHM